MKILMTIIITILTVLAVLYFIIGNYFYNIALNPKTIKTFLVGIGMEQAENTPSKVGWLNENSKDVYITTSNNGNLKLHAYEVTNIKNSDIWVIELHGYCSKGTDMTYYAKEFYNKGYNVLVLDLRGHGQSEGDYIGMGWHDRLDVIDWVNYLIKKNQNCKIILHGVSMGAATVMMATGENLPPNVKVAIEDCGYTSIWEQFEVQLTKLYNLPSFPILNAASAVSKIKAGYRISEGSCIEQVKKSKTPTLFIHGQLDSFVPFDMLDKLYEVANCKKKKLVIERAGHAESSSVNQKLYWETINEFIAENI